MSKWNVNKSIYIEEQFQTMEKNLSNLSEYQELLIPNSSLLYFKSAVQVSIRRNFKLKDFVKNQI